MDKGLMALIVLGQMFLLPSGPFTRPIVQRAPEPRQTQASDFQIKLEAELVNVNVTVTDEQGRAVGHLTKEDFLLFEDDARQAVLFFRTDYDTPLSVGILLDTSTSMQDKMAEAKSALIHFTELIHPEDEVFLIAFHTLPELAQDFTPEREAFAQAAARLEAHGYTSLYDALILGLKKIRAGRHDKKVLLLITDGKDTSSAASFSEALREAEKSNVLIYGLGIGSKKKVQSQSPVPGERKTLAEILSGRTAQPVRPSSSNQRPETRNQTKDAHRASDMGRRLSDPLMWPLLAFAEVSGGRACPVESVQQGGENALDKVCSEIASELRLQYSLGYAPTNKKKDGAWRRIRVETVNPTYRVRARAGYYASKE
jgi:Ca-activated chloride channel family protein